MLQMLDESKLAYQLALEVAKQLITISTAIITFSVAIGKDVFKQSPTLLVRGMLTAALACYLISMWFGVVHIQSLTGSLEVAAIEQAARPDPAAASKAAREYLDSSSSDAVAVAAGERLSDLGVIVGRSAKFEAGRQIYVFLLGTLFIVGYVATMLFTPAKPPSALDPWPPGGRRGR